MADPPSGPYADIVLGLQDSCPLLDRFHAWLLWLGDPMPRGAPPATPLDGAYLERLAGEGDRHRVSPAIARNIRRVTAERGTAAVLRAGDPEAALAAMLNRLDFGVAHLVGRAELLRAMQQELLERLAATGVPAAVLKGSSFADRLYPDPALRPFDDIDLMLPDKDFPAARAVLTELGYRHVPQISGRHAGHYAEEKWAHPVLGTSPVELHWDLVNSPKLRRRVSLDFAQLERFGMAEGRPTAEALLYIAAIHAAAGHGFDRLQQIFDMVQAARGAAGPIDCDALQRLAAETGGGLALRSSLVIAGSLTGDPAMLALAAVVARDRRTRGLARIFGRSPILTAHNSQRSRHAWRRQLYRELLARLS